jgi:hypothetical protein
VSVLVAKLFSACIKPHDIFEAGRDPVQVVNILPVQRALIENLTNATSPNFWRSGERVLSPCGEQVRAERYTMLALRRPAF